MKRAAFVLRAAALAAAVALVACSKAADPAPPPPPAPAFVSDDHGDGAAVFLRGRADGDKVLVDVVARGAADVHGAALRVRFDPKVLAFASAQSSGVWSKDALGVSKEGTPGQLAIAWTEKGEIGIEATAESTLGTLTFTRLTRDAAALTFKTERCALVDRHGAPVAVQWRGGTVASRESAPL